MTDVGADLMRIFREEAAERLDRVDETLLAVERGAASSDALDALFRDLHSIKGNAGMVGVEEARSVAHAMEDVLETAREGGALAVELVDPLLRGSDAIRAAVAGATGVADAALRGLSGAAPAAPAPPTSAANGDAPSPAAASAGSSIRVAAGRVDELLDVVGESVLHQRRLGHLVSEEAGSSRIELGEELDRGERLLGELQHSIIQMRTLPLSTIAGRFPRAVRDLARREGKAVELTIVGAETQLDRVILDGISETITHLLTNAVVHGLEPATERQRAGKTAEGSIVLRAEQRGEMVAIEVVDDGRGVSAQTLREAERHGSLAGVLAQAGFSTAGEVTEAAGRGVGLDAVKARVESLGGSLEAASEPGAGTRMTLLLPFTLALLRVLLVERGGHALGLPLAAITEAHAVTDTVTLGGRPSLALRGATVPLVDLAALIGSQASPLPDRPTALLLTTGGAPIAAMCDRVLGEREVVVKALGPLLAQVAGYLGAAILEDGRVALVLDPAVLVRRRATPTPPVAEAPEPAGPPQVLVVDDQFTVRELQRSILEAAGYGVRTASDGRQALAAIAEHEDLALVLTDLHMPEMDGFALLESLRADPRHAQLPVVVVTSREGKEDRRRGAEAGADAYIVKQDFDQQALLATVDRLISA